MFWINVLKLKKDRKLKQQIVQVKKVQVEYIMFLSKFIQELQ